MYRAIVVITWWCRPSDLPAAHPRPTRAKSIATSRSSQEILLRRAMTDSVPCVVASSTGRAGGTARRGASEVRALSPVTRVRIRAPSSPRATAPAPASGSSHHQPVIPAGAYRTIMTGVSARVTPNSNTADARLPPTNPAAGSRPLRVSRSRTARLSMEAGRMVTVMPNSRTTSHSIPGPIRRSRAVSVPRASGARSRASAAKGVTAQRVSPPLSSTRRSLRNAHRT